MCKGLIGQKLGMTSLFLPDGRYAPVTVLQAGPCVVTQIKTTESDGYNALQLGWGDKRDTRTTKPLKGHFKKSGGQCYSVVHEIPVDNPEDYKLGQTITTELFKVGERVNISGTTKGRGFAGVIKRHGFHGGRMTHGSHSKRIPGAVGMCAWPAKVIKGKKLPGQYGNVKQTVRNLEIVDIRPDDNLIMLKGAVPGHKAGMVLIKKLKFAS